MKKLLLTAFAGCLLSLAASAQSGTGRICFIRATGYVGSAVNFHAYIDDKLACKMQNKTYSFHTVPAGEHTVSASNSGLGSHKKSEPFTVTVKEGETVYVDVVWADNVFCQEITPNSADTRMKKLKENSRCQTGR